MTSLGERLSDPAQRSVARVEAFLQVPLYRAVFDKYNGLRLPGDSGLEAEMQRLGVAPKQAARARQAMARSAEVAGFYGNGRDRLVEPPVRRVSSNPKDSPSLQDPREDEKPPRTTKVSVMDHPLISGLLAVLPEPGQPLSATRRQEWIATLTANMKFIWPEPESSSPAEQRQPSTQSSSGAQS